MAVSYGITKTGRYHENTNTVCQDAHKILTKGNYVFAAVADGVGSNTHSHIASRIGADEAVDYCAEHIDESKTEEEILEIIKEAFLSAKIKIDLSAEEEKAKSPKEHKEYQFHTTLSLAVYTGGKLYYGQSGDSGILALTKEGRVELVTIQQRDRQGRVFPLAYGGKYWQFGVFEKEVASVMLVTDGVLEAVIPKRLILEKEKIYVAMACYFMDNAILQIPENDIEQIKCSRESYVENVIAKEIYDDLTVAVIMDTEQEISYQEDAYYDIPEVISQKKEENTECECQEIMEENTNCKKRLPAAVKEKFTNYRVTFCGLPKFTIPKSFLQNLKRK